MNQISIAKPLARIAALLLATAGAAFAQNVVQPGDPIIASSSNSPGSEGVANAIDGTQAKYLNFDAGQGKPTGFIVTPSVGATRLDGLAMESANDAPDRDPLSVTLEGSNDETITDFNSGNWTLIYANTNIEAWTTLYPTNNRYAWQTFRFSTDAAYKHYRWTVLETQGWPTEGCCMQIAEVQLLGSVLPGVVTTPGDPIIASSSNSPGSEGVANAIDQTQAKYLNFDAGQAKPTGFVVTPSLGATLVTGLSMESANDAPDRDPLSVTLEGSNDDTVSDFSSGNWTLIYANTNIEAWTTLFPTNNRYATQTFLFDNYTPYKHYRWTVLETQGWPTEGCCMQIAEVGILGTAAPKNILQPSDGIIASSSNSPGSEGVANAIDGTQAKYLNFDAGQGKPTGFVVTPQVGATTVIGISMESANDAPDRDPLSITIEGSNDDTVTDFASGNWSLIYANTNIEAWTTLFPTNNRYATQTFYFPNQVPYKHYRWTVLETQGWPTEGCCMQIAEVELLAVTASNPCGQTAFVVPPVDTPVLSGASATFITEVNGPWTLQWLLNGTPIPGATATTYTTPAITAANATNVYQCAIVGCQTSAPVHAVIFQPSSTVSYGVNFVGGGANGAPTPVPSTLIAGVQQQAYWNNATNASGSSGDGASMDANGLLDSNGNVSSTVTFNFQSDGTWGAGVGTTSPVQQLLNGLTYANAGSQNPTYYQYSGVTAGSKNSILLYVVSPPLQFQDVNYMCVGAVTNTVYIRALESGEWKGAPGFYSGSSTDPANPTVADFVRFDNVVPDSSGNITVYVTCTTSGYDRGTGVNAIQLLANSTSPGTPPIITQNPQPTQAALGATATLTVAATGNNLTYQWRKGGFNLHDTGDISGSSTSTLTISPFSAADVGVYSVAVFSPAGSTISKNASVWPTTYNIQDQLAGYWKFDEKSGTNAANSASGGVAAGAVGNPTWVAGEVNGAFSFDGATFLYVPSYTVAKTQISGSAWVNLSANPGTDVTIYRNGQGPLENASSGSARKAGQFELDLALNANDGNLYAEASIGIGPNIGRVTAPTAYPVGTGWHQLGFTYDGAQLLLWMDGQTIGEGDYVAPVAAPDVPFISIGAWLTQDPTVTNVVSIIPDNGITSANQTPNWNTGLIDELALWDRALSSTEVGLLYAAGHTGKALDTVVVPPPVTKAPTLNISISGTQLILSWDPTATGFTLQGASSLTSPSWAPVSGVSGNKLTISPSSGPAFYRLHQ